MRKRIFFFFFFGYWVLGKWNNVRMSPFIIFISYKGDDGDIILKKAGRPQPGQVIKVKGWDRKTTAWMRLKRHNVLRSVAEQRPPRTRPYVQAEATPGLLPGND